MKRVEFSLWLILGSLLGAGAALAEEGLAEVQHWLEKTFRAAHTLSYDGTFVYGHNGKLDAMRIVHSASQNGDRERLVALSGPMREVLRDDSVVTCILPDNKSVVVGKARPTKQLPPTFAIHVRKLSEHYRFALGGVERVAGRDARRLNIEPRDDYRYGYHLWIDTDTGLLLRSELLDENGEAVEQFMFTELRFLDEVPPALLEASIAGQEYTWYEPQEQSSDTQQASSDWVVSKLPGGFELDMHRKGLLSTSSKPVEHMIYSDGLSSVSVFIEDKSDAVHNLQGSSRMGAVNAYGRVLNGRHITIMGEVPPGTIQLIGESLRFQGRTETP